MAQGPSPFVSNRLLVYKPWVPRRLRFWLIIMFAFFYQLTGGVYLAALSQMVGELSFISEDVTMASYCSLIGLNMIFPVLFRWKFYFYSRQMWFVSSVGSIVCALVAPYSAMPWLLWLVCLFAGYFKMMGMFGCMSTIQLNITPTRNYGVFFPVVYVLVCGAIQVSGLMTAYVSYSFNWKFVYLIIVGLMLIVDVIVYFMMNHDHRGAPFVPLKGVDWTGHVLWVATCCVATWIFNFGEHYEWWESREIWIATWIFMALMVVTLLESHFNKNPFISLDAFRYPVAWKVAFVLLGMAVLQASAHVLQPVFMTAVAGYDYFTIVNFNYPEIYGIIMGAVLTYFAIVRWKWRMKIFFFTSFLFITFYLISSYFLIDPSTDAWMFYIPLFSFGVGEVMMESAATYMICTQVPFQHTFMNVAIIGFARCGVGTAAAGAVVERMFAWTLKKNIMLTSSEADTYYGEIGSWIEGYFSSQNIMLAIKECLGYLVLVGFIMMLLMLFARFSPSVTRLLPKMSTAARWITHPHTTPDPTL